MIHIDINRLLIVLSIVFLSLIVAVPAPAQQRGMGDDEGLARQQVRPLARDLSGVVVAVEEGPCALTTGRATQGAHVILRTADQARVNLHLGPAAALPDLLARLKPGIAVRSSALWTDRMPDDSYVARTVVVGDDTFVLRDDALRPAWRMGPGGGGGQGYRMGMGMGQGMGPGQGQGMGPGQGQGMMRGSGNPGGPGPCWW
jgi:hypothetical protein